MSPAEIFFGALRVTGLPPLFRDAKPKMTEIMLTWLLALGTIRYDKFEQEEDAAQSVPIYYFIFRLKIYLLIPCDVLVKLECFCDVF